MSLQITEKGDGKDLERSATMMLCHVRIFLVAKLIEKIPLPISVPLIASFYVLSCTNTQIQLVRSHGGSWSKPGFASFFNHKVSGMRVGVGIFFQ